MDKIQKIRGLIFFIFLLIVFAALGISFKDKKKQIIVKEDTQYGPSGNATIELENVSYGTTGNGNIKEWDLKATSAKYYKKEDKIVLENLEVFIYHEEKVYHLTGKHGEFDTNNRNIRMSGDVVGVMPDDTRIGAEKIFYDHERRIITTDDRIVIKRGKFTMEGLGMVLDLNEEKLSLLGKVKAKGNI